MTKCHKQETLTSQGYKKIEKYISKILDNDKIIQTYLN